MIEKIHAIWLGKKMNAMSFACIDDWQKQGYDHKLWTEGDEEITNWIEECTFAKECYKRGLYAFVSDYLRLKILQKEGGLYLDTDVTIQKNPFELFNELEFSVGYENENDLGTAVIYSTPDSKILNCLINFYENEIYSSPLFMGPGIMTEFLIKRQLSDLEANELFPINYFYGYQGEKLTFEKPQNSYLIHWFQHSWKNDKKATYLKSKHMNAWGKFYTWQKYLLR